MLVFENSAHVLHFRICCSTILAIILLLKNFVTHKHIMYYTQSTVCQRGCYERNSSNTVSLSFQLISSSPWAYVGFAKVELNFLGDGQVAFREAAFDSRCSQAFARVVWGYTSPRNFFKWSNLVRFGSYSHKHFT